MLRKIINAMIGDTNEKELKRLRPLVESINEKEEEYQNLSDDELKGKTFDKVVNNFDSHTFDKGVAFCTSVPKAQKNLLGYAQLQADTWLRHPEHEDRLLKMGLYEIRQARSYENNPAGNWSLTID